MIKKLSQLTVDRFVDLVCGEAGVLCEKDEKVPEKELTETIRNIVFEYKAIADPGGAMSFISSMEELIKAQISISVFSICQNLVSLNELDRVREVLAACGINAGPMNDLRVIAEVKSRLGRAKRVIEDAENDRKDKSENMDIRREFDAQTAAMMAYFKFQIDTSEMKASVYAHLVSRHNKEIKAMKSAVRRK